MRELKVKKIVGLCFVEATKLCLDQLGVHRLSLGEQGVVVPPDLVRSYADCRRLRDYIQSCVRSGHELIEFDLEPQECALLVACCHRLVETLHQQLEKPLTDRDRQFLQKKQKVIADWAVELVEKPILRLPLPPVLNGLDESPSDLKRRLEEKIYSGSQQAMIRDGQAIPMSQSPTSSAAAMAARKLLEPGGQPLDIFGVSESGEDPRDASTLREGDILDVDPESSAPGDSDAGDESGESEAEPDPPALLDASVLRDSRLRSLVAVDLRSLRMAEQARDFRVSTVVLAAILEAAVIDYALPRKEELELTGAPDSWCPREVLLSILGDQIPQNERILVYQLFLSRDMLKPGFQLQTPTVANAASVERMRTFVISALFQLGYCANPGSEPESESAPESEPESEPAPAPAPS